MNKIDSYLEQLAHELNDLPAAERAEIIAEIETHIEAGLENEPANRSDSENVAHLLQDLGSPAELARNLNRANWKRNLLLAGLAIVPLLLLNPLNVFIDNLLNMSDLAIVFGYLVNFLICLGMIWLARRLHSNYLVGWWLSNTLAVVFNQFFFFVSWPDQWLSGYLWRLTPIIFMFVTAGFYGRYLWQNRYDGLAIFTVLVPFMWTTTYLMAYNAVLSIDDLIIQTIVTVNLSVFIIIMVALVIFILPGRRQRWVALAVATAVYTVSTFLIWLPDPNAVFWLLLILPLLSGFGIEFASARQTRMRVSIS